MKNKEHVFNEAVHLICSGFEDEKADLLKNKDFVSFHYTLSCFVRVMLYKDYNRLINILYKIDVDEKKYIQLFKESSSDKLPDGLANLIIERTIQKAEMRRKYK